MDRAESLDGFASCKCPACAAFVVSFEAAGCDETDPVCESAWQVVRRECPAYSALETAQSA